MPTKISEFHTAIERCNLKKFKAYIEKVDVNAQDKHGRTGLYLLLAKNFLSILSEDHIFMLDTLLEKGADIYLKHTVSECTSLDMAILNSDMRVLKRLLEKKLITDCSKKELLLYLASLNTSAAAQAHTFLLQKKLLKGGFASTQSLVFSSEEERIKKIILLLENGANVTNEVLEVAIKNNNTKTAEAAIDFILVKNLTVIKSDYIKDNTYLSQYWDKKFQEISALPNRLEDKFSHLTELFSSSCYATATSSAENKNKKTSPFHK